MLAGVNDRTLDDSPLLAVKPIRLFHLTFYKCGSQWVRDILSDPRIVEHSLHPLGVSGIDLLVEAWPQLRTGQLASPVYCAGSAHWQNNSTSDDRAVVVIRDPRDIVISLIHSLTNSHAANAVTMLLREPLAHSSQRDRLQIGMFLLAQWVDYLRSWRDVSHLDRVFVSRYESLVGDLAGELTRLFQFLQWPIPEDIVRTVADYHSFECRTGRQPGEENEFSHRRKGIAGDWRNYFDRSSGEFFERIFPSLLLDFGYEASNTWWQHLPASVSPLTAAPEEERGRLMSVLREYEQELAVVRVAAEERLAALHTERDNRMNIERSLAVLRVAAEERLAALHAARDHRMSIEQSLAWRFGFRPLRALFSLVSAAPQGGSRPFFGSKTENS